MNEKLQEAATLYKKGDKSQALKLLAEIVKQEPNNSDAWYGLALCLDDPEKKVYCLKRVLSINPLHEKAQLILVELESGKKPQNIQNKPQHQSPTTVRKPEKNTWKIISLLGVSGFVLICVLIFGAIALINVMPFFSPIPFPTNTPATNLVVPTSSPLPQPTIQPTLLPGPARRYVPITNEEMPANYINPIVDEYRLDDGNYYRIEFSSLDGGTVLLDEPKYLFFAFVGNTMDDAIRKYREASQSFQVDSNNWQYNWSENTYNSLLFDESGQYIGYMGNFGEVGRVFRANNVVVLITVRIRNMSGISSSDISKLQQDLDKYTKIVEQKFR